MTPTVLTVLISASTSAASRLPTPSSIIPFTSAHAGDTARVGQQYCAQARHDRGKVVHVREVRDSAQLDGSKIRHGITGTQRGSSRRDSGRPARWTTPATNLFAEATPNGPRARGFSSGVRDRLIPR